MGVIAALILVFGSILTSPVYLDYFLVKVCQTQNIPLTTELVYQTRSFIFTTLIVFPSLLYGIMLISMANKLGIGGGIFKLAAAIGVSTGSLLVLVNSATMKADGSITPIVSILSAMEEMKAFGISQEQAMIISGFILLGILLALYKGLGYIARYASPATILYISLAFICGIYAIVQHPEVIIGLHPKYAFQFMVNNPIAVPLSLLPVIFLCTTGAEAKYLDLEQIGGSNIRVAWWAVVMPFLIAVYFGQGAILLSHVKDGIISLPVDFSPWYEMWYNLFGHGFPQKVIAILITAGAVIVASFTILTGDFDLYATGVKLGLLPELEEHYPTKYHSQLYIPKLVILFAIGSFVILFYYKESAHMATPYSGLIVLAFMSTFTIAPKAVYMAVSKIEHVAKRIVMYVTATLVLAIGWVFILIYAWALLPETWHHGKLILGLTAFYVWLMITWKAIKAIKEKSIIYVSAKVIEEGIKNTPKKVSAKQVDTLILAARVKKEGETFLFDDKIIEGCKNYIFTNLVITSRQQDEHHNKGWDYEFSNNGIFVHIHLLKGLQASPFINRYLRKIPEINEFMNGTKLFKVLKRRIDSYSLLTSRLREDLLMKFVYPIFANLIGKPETQVFSDYLNPSAIDVYAYHADDLADVGEPGKMSFE